MNFLTSLQKDVEEMVKKNIFADVKRVVSEIKRLEGKRPRKKRTWDESIPQYIKRIRQCERENCLLERCPERRCPICLKVKLRSKQWVILHRETLKLKCTTADVLEATVKILMERGVVCLSCYQKLFRG